MRISTGSFGTMIQMTYLKTMNWMWMRFLEPKSWKRQRQLNQQWMNRLREESRTPVDPTDDSFSSDPK